mgnify:CR=1 FL=1
MRGKCSCSARISRANHQATRLHKKGTPFFTTSRLSMTSVVLTRSQLWRYVWSNKPEQWELDANEVRRACQVLGVPCPDAAYWERVDKGLPVVQRKFLKEAGRPKSVSVPRVVHRSVVARDARLPFPSITLSALYERQRHILSRLFYGAERLGFGVAYNEGRWGVRFSSGSFALRCSLREKYRRVKQRNHAGEDVLRLEETGLLHFRIWCPPKGVKGIWLENAELTMEQCVPEILAAVKLILLAGPEFSAPRMISRKKPELSEIPDEERLWERLVEEANNFEAHRRVSGLLDAMRQHPGSKHQVVGGRTVEGWLRILSARVDTRDPLRRGPAALIKRLIDEQA